MEYVRAFPFLAIAEEPRCAPRGGGSEVPSWRPGLGSREGLQGQGEVTW